MHRTVADQNLRQIELDGFRAVIRCAESNDLAMLRWFGQDVLIRPDQVAERHVVAVRIFARTYYVSFKVDGTFAVGKNWRHCNFVAILDSKGFNRLPCCLRATAGRNVYAYCNPFIVRLDTLDPYVTHLCRHHNAAS